MTGAVETLAGAIGYPDEPATVGGAAVFVVDGGEVRVREEGGRLVLMRSLCAADQAPDLLVRLAELAAGRALKEEATLAWDPALGVPILWQDVPARASEQAMRRTFELFCTSCDWWLARTAEEGGASARLPEMVILP